MLTKAKVEKKSLTIGMIAGSVIGEKTIRLVLKSDGAVQELFLQVDTIENIPTALQKILNAAHDKIRGIEIRLKDGVTPSSSEE